MVGGVQKLSKSLGEYGCYFFSLLNVAENMGGGEYEPIFEANYAIKKGLLGQDCFVADSAGISDPKASVRVGGHLAAATTLTGYVILSWHAIGRWKA